MQMQVWSWPSALENWSELSSVHSRPLLVMKQYSVCVTEPDTDLLDSGFNSKSLIFAFQLSMHVNVSHLMEGASAGYCTVSDAVETWVGRCPDRGHGGRCRWDPVIAVWPNFQLLQNNKEHNKCHENCLYVITVCLCHTDVPSGIKTMLFEGKYL